MLYALISLVWKLIHFLLIEYSDVIVASPISVTVCAGENAEFYCTTANGAPLRWSVDGMDAGTNAVNARNISFVTRTYYQSPSSNGYTSTLTVYGSIANSNSSIQCFARYNNVIFETDVAVLLVQGICTLVKFIHDIYAMIVSHFNVTFPMLQGAQRQA